MWHCALQRRHCTPAAPTHGPTPTPRTMQPNAALIATVTAGVGLALVPGFFDAADPAVLIQAAIAAAVMP